MPRVNLLPIKSVQRNEQARNELLLLVGIGALLIVGLYWWHGTLLADIDAKQTTIRALEREVKDLKEEASRVEEFEEETAKLEDKLVAIDKLKVQKIGPAMLLDDIATLLTEFRKVWLKSISEQDNGFIVFEGFAMDHDDISDFQLGLEKRSRFFKDVQLGPVQLIDNDDVNYLEWQITCVADYSAE